MFETQVISYKNFGKCLKMTNGVIDLVVTLDVGPRVIYYGFCGGPNTMFEDIDRKFKNSESYTRNLFGEDACWYIYGGHRLWVSPEIDETYFPDNYPVDYKVSDNGADFYQVYQEQTGYKFTLSVKMGDDTKVELNHTVTNQSGKDKTFAPWAITVLNGGGGTEIIELNPSDNPLLPNQKMILWPYTNLSDSRLKFMKKFITLKQDPNITQNIKLGLDNKTKYAMYINNNQMFVKRFEYENGTYPDGGANFETYTVESFIEMETLGHTQTVKDGQSVHHKEAWELYDNIDFEDFDNENKINEFVKQYK